MTQGNLARSKLQQARFFLEKATIEKAAGGRDSMLYLIEAAIVFGRSVTFCLQKDHKHKMGFDRWYSEKQEAMKSDPVFVFFRDERTYILKKGRSSIHKVVSIGIEASISSSVYVEARVIRGRPWYSRSFKVLVDDLILTIMNRYRRWLHNRKIRRQQRLRQRPRTEIHEDVFFDDPKWENRPALQLLKEYLDELEMIVDEAGVRFGTSRDQEY